MTVGCYRTMDAEGDGFRAALAWIRGEGWKTLPRGRYEIADGVYAMVQEYTSKELGAGRFENHHLYADIQMVIEGREMMYSTTDAAVAGEGCGYDAEGDIEFFGGYASGASSVFMEPGRVCMLYPGDFHMPGMAWGSPAPVRKLVVKVKVS